MHYENQGHVCMPMLEMLHNLLWGADRRYAFCKPIAMHPTPDTPSPKGEHRLHEDTSQATSLLPIRSLKSHTVHKLIRPAERPNLIALMVPHSTLRVVRGVLDGGGSQNVANGERLCDEAARGREGLGAQVVGGEGDGVFRWGSGLAGFDDCGREGGGGEEEDGLGVHCCWLWWLLVMDDDVGIGV
jgi:hypothetical protein